MSGRNKKAATSLEPTVGIPAPGGDWAGGRQSSEQQHGPFWRRRNISQHNERQGARGGEAWSVLRGPRPGKEGKGQRAFGDISYNWVPRRGGGGQKACVE